MVTELRTSRGSPPMPVDCVLFSAGHAVHWIPALRTANDPYWRRQAWPGRVVSLTGEVVVLDAGDRLIRYRNHDVPRIAAYVQRWGNEALLSTPRYPIMRLGGGGCFSVRLDTGTSLDLCVSAAKAADADGWGRR